MKTPCEAGATNSSWVSIGTGEEVESMSIVHWRLTALGMFILCLSIRVGSPPISLADVKPEGEEHEEEEGGLTSMCRRRSNMQTYTSRPVSGRTRP